MNIHSIYMGQNHILWAADQGSNKLNAYDEDGHYLYSWGTFGNCQGCMWGVHGFVTDTDGTLYTAEVRTGRVQKYTPRKDANPEFLVGKPWGLVQRTQAAR
jgi:sugar lactone lactonase YvrE